MNDGHGRGVPELQPRQAQCRARPRGGERPAAAEATHRRGRRRSCTTCGPTRLCAAAPTPTRSRRDTRALVHCAIRRLRLRRAPTPTFPRTTTSIQAVSGLAGAQEWMAGEPTYVASAVGDKVAGMMAALAITAALHGRAADGGGTEIEVPMAESVASFGMVEHLWGRTFVPPRGEARYPRMSSVLRRPFRTADGFISRGRSTRTRTGTGSSSMIGEPELGNRSTVRDACRAHRAPRRAVHARGRPPRDRDHRRSGSTGSPRRGSPRCPTTGSTTCSTTRTSRTSGSGRGRAPDRGHDAAVPDADHVRRRAPGPRGAAAQLGADTAAVLRELDG